MIFVKLGKKKYKTVHWVMAGQSWFCVYSPCWRSRQSLWVRLPRFSPPLPFTGRPWAGYLIFLGLSSSTYQKSVRMHPSIKHRGNVYGDIFMCIKILVCKEKRTLLPVSTAREATKTSKERVEKKSKGAKEKAQWIKGFEA